MQKQDTQEETAPEQDAEQEVWDACVQKEDGDDRVKKNWISVMRR